MADLTIQDVPAGGLANVTKTAAAAGQTIPANTGTRSMGGWESESVFLIAFNTDVATRDVTVGGQAAVTVPANTGVAVIPVLNPGVNGAAQAVAYSAVGNVSVALCRVGK